MNNERRTALRLLDRKIIELSTDIADIRDELEILKDAEQEAYDNLPESLQAGSKGDAAQAALDELQQAFDALDAAGYSLDEASGSINNAVEG